MPELDSVEEYPYLRPAVPTRPQVRDRLWLHWSLFALTALTTTATGLVHYLSFLSNFGAMKVTAGWASAGYGLWYSGSLLAILTAHEFGHYIACRYYRVAASLPYFLPMYPFFLGLMTGTLGAVIRIREPIYTKRVLFDVGIAGPIAGFVVAVPLLVVGLALSTTAPVPSNFAGLELGEPLGFQLAQWMIFGVIPQGRGLNLHPMGLAAWWGLFLTAFNLIPALQLDGGHIAYAVLGRRAVFVTYGVLAALVALTLVSVSWVLPAVLLAAFLYFFGAHHPPVLDEDQPLDRVRLMLAAFAVVMFVLCFTPAPIALIGLGD